MFLIFALLLLLIDAVVVHSIIAAAAAAATTVAISSLLLRSNAATAVAVFFLPSWPPTKPQENSARWKTGTPKFSETHPPTPKREFPFFLAPNLIGCLPLVPG